MECRFCKKECKNENSLRNHERLCKLNPDRQDIKSWLNKDYEHKSPGFSGHKHQKGEFACEFCGRVFPYKSSCNLHIKYCKLNPNRIERVGHPQTEESKIKISKTQKDNFKEGKSRWNIDRSQTSYAEKYFIKWLDTFTIYRHNYWTNRFYLDFAQNPRIYGILVCSIEQKNIYIQLV